MKETRSLPDDLSVLSRRGEASPSDERRLAMLLGASTLERWLDDLGRDFDRDPTDDPESHALLDRVVQRVTDTTCGRPQPPRRPWTMAVTVLATSLVAFGAAALSSPLGLSFLSAPDVEKPSPACAACTAPSGDETHTSPRAAPADNEAAPALEEESPAPAAAPAAALSATPPSATPPSATPPSATPPKSTERARETAAELFSKANALRRSGQAGAAIDAYQALQRQHPRSAEALLSHVVLGRLLLQRGSPREARDQFGRYLRASPGGSLAEEALHGQASALRRLGDAAAERAVHEMLLARFPRSIYAKTSRQRLQELP